MRDGRVGRRTQLRGTAQRRGSGTWTEVGYHSKWHRRALRLAVRQAAADASQSRARLGRQGYRETQGYTLRLHNLLREVQDTFSKISARHRGSDRQVCET